MDLEASGDILVVPKLRDGEIKVRAGTVLAKKQKCFAADCQFVTVI